MCVSLFLFVCVREYIECGSSTVSLVGRVVCCSFLFLFYLNKIEWTRTIKTQFKKKICCLLSRSFACSLLLVLFTTVFFSQFRCTSLFIYSFALFEFCVVIVVLLLTCWCWCCCCFSSFAMNMNISKSEQQQQYGWNDVLSWICLSVVCATIWLPPLPL